MAPGLQEDVPRCAAAGIADVLLHIDQLLHLRRHATLTAVRAVQRPAWLTDSQSLYRDGTRPLHT